MKLHALISGLFLAALQFTSHDAHALGRMKQNMHLIQEDQKGFAIYRTSEPNAADMQNFCKLGITEMMVLSGDGQIDTDLAKKYCPQLKVVYNTQQTAKIPMSGDFLDGFDSWVKESQAMGKKIAFRCHCGCHRTGRLAAYYQMKYMGYSAEAANKDLRKFAKYMILYPFLDNQVRALHDYVEGKSCSEKEKYCVRKNDAPSDDIAILARAEN
ncbi:MAG: dual specificity protein phosphatase family protein [Cryobacterium sp.]|nr:dual specificity protein phosphatase family protein [Oligoflexia bacterium]